MNPLYARAHVSCRDVRRDKYEKAVHAPVYIIVINARVSREADR